MGQRTGIAWASSLGVAADQTAMLKELIVQTRGHMIKISHLLGIHRSTLYERINQLGLWPLVNKVRRTKVAVEDLKNRIDC